MDDAQSGDRMRPGFVARRVRMPSSGVESWTVVGPDGRAVEVIDEFVGWLIGIERSPTRGVRQPAAAAGAGSPVRAATECSRLSREEISTNARIAPARAKPAPTRNAWSKPLVRATEALWTPEW